MTIGVGYRNEGVAKGGGGGRRFERVKTNSLKKIWMKGGNNTGNLIVP